MRTAFHPFLLLGLAALFAAPAAAQLEPRRVTTLAPGVYVIEHEDLGDNNRSGNTMVVVGARQVLVVDACYLPSTAREDIAQIRRWTDRPVAFVVNTHFHNDHNLGNSAYADAFPGVTIIAQAETKQDEDRFGPGSLARHEATITRLQHILETGRTANGQVLSSSDQDQVRAMIAQRRAEEDDIRRSPFQSATLTFRDSLAIDLGGREVDVEFLGRGNTAGDAVVYLPHEKIVATGDLLVEPIPYVFDGYPSEWTGTLERLSRLDAETFVPGHGPIMHDRAYLTLVHDLMASVETQLNATLIRIGPALAHTVDDVRGQIDVSSFRQRFAGSDAELGAEFDATVRHLISVAFAEASLR